MIFKEGNKTEMEKKDYIWRTKIYFLEENKAGKEKKGIYLETENMFFAKEKINSRGKGGIIGEGKYVFCGAKE